MSRNIEKISQAGLRLANAADSFMRQAPPMVGRLVTAMEQASIALERLSESMPRLIELLEELPPDPRITELEAELARDAAADKYFDEQACHHAELTVDPDCDCDGCQRRKKRGDELEFEQLEAQHDKQAAKVRAEIDGAGHSTVGD